MGLDKVDIEDFARILDQKPCGDCHFGFVWKLPTMNYISFHEEIVETGSYPVKTLFLIQHNEGHFSPWANSNRKSNNETQVWVQTKDQFRVTADIAQ